MNRKMDSRREEISQYRQEVEELEKELDRLKVEKRNKFTQAERDNIKIKMNVVQHKINRLNKIIGEYYQSLQLDLFGSNGK